jgi:hypothetical protein
MSSAGHVWDAIKRMEYNRNLLKLHRAKYNELKKATSHINAKYSKFKDKSTLSEKELNTYKQKIKSKIVRDRQKAFFISFAFTICTSILIVYAVKFLINLFKTSF